MIDDHLNTLIERPLGFYEYFYSLRIFSNIYFYLPVLQTILK